MKGRGISSFSLEGRVLLVTGAVGAIGATVVAEAASSGAVVMATDVSQPGDPAVQALLKHSSVSYIPCNVTDENDVASVVAAAVARHGRLDGAANIAGIVGPSLTTAEFPLDVFRKVVDVNLVGTYLCMKHQILAMLDSGGAAIVNIGSIAGHSGEMNRSAYASSKAGIVGLTRSAAVEYGGRGIRINMVSPGPVATEMFFENVGRQGTERHARVLDEIPVGRMGTPTDIAAAILWLLSDAAGFVHGHELMVDGGITAEGLSVSRLFKSSAPS
jgi:NAD(P)-dependent dehydrogenase (short-subunit alcohol dehydrogenase family)